MGYLFLLVKFEYYFVFTITINKKVITNTDKGQQLP